MTDPRLRVALALQLLRGGNAGRTLGALAAGELTVAGVVAATGQPRQSVGRHLDRLRAAGLVAVRVDGRRRYHRAVVVAALFGGG